MMKTQTCQSLKLKKVNVRWFIVLAISMSIFSQVSRASNGYLTDTMPFQFSIITPIGTNGMHSWNTVNTVSINLLGGFNGGVNGFEGSVFFSILKGNMNGAQITGFANANLGTSEGFQLAGFVNCNLDSFNGVQLAGFVNAVAKNTSGVQGAGFVNAVVGEFEGAQLAGFVNVATQKVKGFQASGFANFSQGNSVGQLSPFANINVGHLTGLQANAFANINTGTLKGLQISAFVNFTQKLQGVQLGLFNYVDSLERGIPIGLISFVRNGYQSFEVKGTETLYGIGAFKTGVSKFYNIISVGAGYQHNTSLWAFGYGVGTLMTLSEKNDLAIDLECFGVHQQSGNEHPLNLLNKLTVTASHRIGNKAALFGGASFNVVVSDTYYNGESFISAIAPYTMFSKVYSNQTKVEMYAGLTAGIRF